MLTGLEPSELLNAPPLAQAVANDQAAREPKKCACGCGHPLAPRFDGGSRPTLDGKEINVECRDRMLPAFPNQGTPGRRGPGAQTNLD